MGSTEEKSGFMSKNWVTFVLIAVLIVFAAILIIILKTGEGFDRFKRKPDKKPDLKPSVMYQQLYTPDGQPELEWVGDRFRVTV